MAPIAAWPAHEHGAKKAVPTVAAGSAWFAAMVGMWSTFLTLLAVSPETLADVYDWLVGLPIVWEVLLWIVVLPWALAYVVWDSSWDQWLRVVVVVAMAAVHLLISAPRR
jgi:hypothetical protein